MVQYEIHDELKYFIPAHLYADCGWDENGDRVHLPTLYDLYNEGKLKRTRHTETGTWFIKGTLSAEEMRERVVKLKESMRLLKQAIVHMRQAHQPCRLEQMKYEKLRHALRTQLETVAYLERMEQQEEAV